jgi:hypothetical protein
MLSAMEYPHWLMVAGAFLVAAGFIGLSRNRNRGSDDDATETKARPVELGSKSAPTERLTAARTSVSAGAGALTAKGKQQ